MICGGVATDPLSLMRRHEVAKAQGLAALDPRMRVRLLRVKPVFAVVVKSHRAPASESSRARAHAKHMSGNIWVRIIKQIDVPKTKYAHPLVTLASPLPQNMRIRS
jgi:hypothetical protein